MIFLACIAPTLKAGGLGVLPQDIFNIVDVICSGEFWEFDTKSRRFANQKIQETPGKSRRVDKPAYSLPPTRHTWVHACHVHANEGAKQKLCLPLADY